MIFNITHRLNYAFSKPVFLEPHTLFLSPRADGQQSGRSLDLQIDPRPVLLSPILDAAGNPGHKAWFEGTHQKLSVTAEMTVETFRTNAFDFLIDPSFQDLPLTAPAHLQTALAPFLRVGKIEKAVRDFSDDIRKNSGGRTVDFLSALTRSIHEAYPRVNRDDGPAWAPEKTMKEKKGACRDLSLLWIQAVQAQGLAARFVSGYYEADEELEDKDLHAWAEVYLEGGGWRGYDPSNGLAVADRHVALAAHARADQIPPVLGSFRGTDATQKMTFSVTMRKA